MLRLTGILTTALMLSGCATSGALTIASIGASGLSMLISGKNLSDHALSIALQRDCALWRKLRGDPVCAPRHARRPAGGGPPAPVADLGGAGRWTRTADTPTATLAAAPKSAGRSGGRPGTRPISDPGTPPLPAATIADPARHGKDAAPGRVFAVIGSFRLRANAQRLLDSHPRVPVHIITSDLPAGRRHRVVVGPMGQYQLADRRRFRQALHHAGLADGWPIRLCAGSLTAPPCPAGSWVAALDSGEPSLEPAGR